MATGKRKRTTQNQQDKKRYRPSWHPQITDTTRNELLQRNFTVDKNRLEGRALISLYENQNLKSRPENASDYYDNPLGPTFGETGIRAPEWYNITKHNNQLLTRRRAFQTKESKYKYTGVRALAPLHRIGENIRVTYPPFFFDKEDNTYMQRTTQTHDENWPARVGDFGETLFHRLLQEARIDAVRAAPFAPIDFRTRFYQNNRYLPSTIPFDFIDVKYKKTLGDFKAEMTPYQTKFLIVTVFELNEFTSFVAFNMVDPAYQQTNQIDDYNWFRNLFNDRYEIP